MDTLIRTIADSIWAIEPEAAFSLSQQMATAREKPGDPGLEIVDGVAVVTIQGVIQPSGRNQPMFGGVNTVGIRQMIEGLTENEAVEAVLLSIDSPGGSATGLEETAAAISALAKAKPVVAHFDRLGTSAAYYLAAPASQIFAESKSTITGSIGTRILLYDFSEMVADMKVKPIAIDTGEFKSMGAFGLPITDNQISHLQDIVDSLQQGFESIVSENRNLSGKKLDAVTDGRSILASDALSLGLLDGIQSFDETLSKLVSLVTRKEDNAMATSEKATFVELQIIPGVTSDFVVEALGSDWTVDQAMSTWMERQQAALAAARQEAKEASERAAKKADDGDLGDAPPKGSKREDSALSEWDQLVKETMVAREMTRGEAIIYLANQEPEAHEAYLAEYTELNGMPGDVFQASASRRR